MPINNEYNSSLEALPMSPCTDGSLGFDAQFLNSSSLRLSENISSTSLDSEAIFKGLQNSTVVEEDSRATSDETSHESNPTEELTEEEVEEVVEAEDELNEETAVIENHDVAVIGNHDVEDAVSEECEPGHPVEESNDEESVEPESEEVEAQTTAVGNNDVEEVGEKITSMAVSCDNLSEKAISESEVTASDIPNCDVNSDLPTISQTRGLSAASLALKKKQAAANAAAAIKAVAVEVPETDSIANRIRIFGGGAIPRSTGLRKFGVRDMVQKYKNVEEQSQDQIAHVVRGHNDAEPRGVCTAYSLSTASRPLRTTPRRKMSHELGENETRDIVAKFGGMARTSEEIGGVSQESVHSVRNAKSIFETLARVEGAQR
ncbi:hypothetical protein BGZ76_005651 [Entomortierella beljakovae]|nr:hypothetical protein BGZ76_005651 [Entomortierella beljakovae]